MQNSKTSTIEYESLNEGQRKLYQFMLNSYESSDCGASESLEVLGLLTRDISNS